MDSKTCNCNERKKMLSEIGQVSFAMTELNLYLDTHPFDQMAIDKFQKYSSKRNKLLSEYTQLYGPLIIDTQNTNSREWKWATQNWPWERGYQ